VRRLSFKTQFKIEFLGPFNGPKKSLKKSLNASTTLPQQTVDVYTTSEKTLSLIIVMFHLFPGLITILCFSGSDLDGAHTAVCQIKTKRTSEAYSCGNADDRSVRYADGDLTMVYKGGSPCKTGIHRRTIITFRCDPAANVGEPTFVIEDHCYYYFEWKTSYVCPSRKAGACSVVSKSGDTYDLSILTKNTNNTWLAVNDRKKASGYTYYINVCGSLAKMQYRECHESAACEVKDGKGHGIGMYKTTPTISKSGSLSLIYTGGKCPGFVKKNITTIIKFICKNKDLESPPELESKSWDGCDYVFAWATGMIERFVFFSTYREQLCFLVSPLSGINMWLGSNV
jgi:hypothetical protein